VTVKYLTATGKSVAKFLTGKEEGTSLVEYGLLLLLLAVACFAAITLLGTQISSLFVSATGSL
jgi:pilus assembly protein Flp/PilA